MSKANNFWQNHMAETIGEQPTNLSEKETKIMALLDEIETNAKSLSQIEKNRAEEMFDDLKFDNEDNVAGWPEELKERYGEVEKIIGDLEENDRINQKEAMGEAAA